MFEPVFFCILDTDIVYQMEEGQTQCSLGGGVIGMCFRDHRAFSQLRDRLCGEV